MIYRVALNILLPVCTLMTLTSRQLAIILIIASANKDLESIREWLMANKLSLNVAKSEYMIIGSNYHVSKIAWDPQIKLGNNTLDKVKSTKSLGIYISDTLSWSEYTDFVAKKVSNAVGGLKRGRPYGPIKTIETIYKSLIQPHFSAILNNWCSSGFFSINRGVTRVPTVSLFIYSLCRGSGIGDQKGSFACKQSRGFHHPPS